MSRPDPRVAEVFSALGDGTRLAMVRRLGAGPLSATALAESAPITRQAVTKHLRVLQGAGLVKPARRGREVLYALDPGRLSEARTFLDAVSDRWEKAIERLRSLVEEPANTASGSRKRRFRE